MICVLCAGERANYARGQLQPQMSKFAFILLHLLLLLLSSLLQLSFASPFLNNVRVEEEKGQNWASEESGRSNGTTARQYQVVRAQPDTGEQLQLLEMLEMNGSDLELNFWTSPVRVGSAVDVMVPTDKGPILRRYLRKHQMHTEVIIEDVERLIIQRERKVFGRKEGDDRNRFLADEPPTRRMAATANKEPNFDFYHYNSYAQMVAWMRALARRHPKLVQFITIGKTHEGRSIDGLEIGSRGFRKRAFWIDGGIHAREWAAPHTALYFIHLLTSRYGKDAEITRLLDELTWVVVPLLNPDGYEFTRSSTHPNVRLWRKNRSPTHCVRDQWGRNRCCKGVDLNRNFDFHFKESGSSDDPCSEIYQGISAFSEPESRSIRDAVLSNRYRGRIDGFITLHTYSQIWIHPYGHKRDSYPGDVQDLYAVGKRATAALSKLYGTKYVLGSGANTLYPASGGSEDWAKESANVKFVYLLELRPDEKNWDGFILDESQLIPTASETWAGVKVVADAIIQRARTRRISSVANKAAGIRQYRPTATDGSNNLAPMKMEQKMHSLPAENQRNAESGEFNCKDRHRSCKRWVLEGESLCQTVPVFMGDQCAFSCGFC
ncbi:hypothetical protein niasHT_001143 [Heterodera trifolii]|uniref:ShKT domain-containing protein n=1 Tax=Heterodera trifolii TaxID=157864 RepID=A0ABD2LYJ6_9BILA